MGPSLMRNLVGCKNRPGAASARAAACCPNSSEWAGPGPVPVPGPSQFALDMIPEVASHIAAVRSSQRQLARPSWQFTQTRQIELETCEVQSCSTPIV